MKKFVFPVIAGLVVSLNFVSCSWWLSLSDFTPALDKKVSKFETTQEKVKFLQSFSDLLSDKIFTTDKNAWLFADLRNYSLSMLNVFQHQLIEENKNSQNNSDFYEVNLNLGGKMTKLPVLSDKFSNVDINEVRKAVLKWHNDERRSLWLKEYKYNLDLEWTAITWANNLANSGKTKNLHARSSNDGYYNYDSLLSWFSNLWVKFPKSMWWWASFSESIWYGMYKCSSSDCTQNLINAIKTTWDGLIMKEKVSNGSHYKAATMKYFTQMWVWIAVNNGRYYMVIHYWVDF